MTEDNKKFIGTRVTKKTLDDIEKYCINNSVSRSKLIRDSINFYLRYAQQDQDSFHPMMIFSKEELKFIFSCMNLNQLKEFADLSYQMGEKTKKYFLNLISSEELKVTPRVLFHSLQTEVFSHKGQNWFSDIAIRTSSKEIIFGGKHRLNKNFSIFVKLLMENYTSDYGYKLAHEKVEENMISLNFTKE